MSTITQTANQQNRNLAVNGKEGVWTPENMGEAGVRGPSRSGALTMPSMGKYGV